jgi:hypothetical protein
MDTPRYETCEIRTHIEKGSYFSIRPTTIYFIARAIGPQGEYVAATSPPVDKWAWDTHRQDAALDTAHRALIRTLAAAGWEPTDRGAEWWQDRFRRRVP